MAFHHRFIAISIVVSCCVSAVASEAIPARIGEWEGQPAWVSAAEAVDVDGQLKPSLFAPYQLEARIRVAQKNSRAVDEKRRRTMASHRNGEVVDDCQIFSGPPASEDFKSTASLTDLANNATAIVAGTVSAIEPGFLYGMPGSLLRFTETAYLKGRPARETFFFYPYSRIQTAHGVICAKPVADYAVPVVGDRFVVFTYIDPPDYCGRVILAADVARAVVHDSRAGLKVPHSLRALADDFDELQAHIRTATQSTNSR